ncbi:MAG TPA: uracil-DNA glycosylase, partial [Hyphomicrobiaceae bacterium]|nr:uracil-DNA glycosylase [Hyphomicrobiaceae bacterium]
DRVAVSQGAGLQGTGSQATGAATRAFTVTAPEIARADARAAAASANSLADLRDRLEAFEGCGLKATAKNLCLFRGSEAARVMIIGEAPGRDEDQDGRPFVGRAGQLLDKMLAAIGLGEPDVHITNVVYWRPPGNRTPTPLEVEVCRPFLDRQIELVRPDVVLSLGGPAAKALLDTSSGIMKVRGKWQDIEASGRQIKIMPTLHPAYLLRTPAAKRLAWRDLLAVKAVLDGG